MPRVLPVLLLLLVASTGLLLAFQVLATKGTAPPTAETAPGAIASGHLYTGITEQPTDLNPFTTSNSVTRTYVLGFTHDTLLDLEPKSGAPRPALAEAWQVGDDGLSVTVRLRQGVQFSDGSPVTLDDVLFTFEVARTPDVVLGSIGDGLQLVESVAADPATQSLRIRLRRVYAGADNVGLSWIVAPRAYWLRRVADLAQRDGVLAPAVGQQGFGALLARLTTSPGPGSGPYVFADDDQPQPSWRRGRDLTLRRHADCWQRAARPGSWNLDGIRFLFVTDGAARHAALVQRSVDWYSGSRLDELLAADAGLAADYRRYVYDKAAYGAILVQWNNRRPQLADAHVRRALGMLFDRERIVAHVFGGVGRPAAAFSKPELPGCPADLAPLPFDPAAARRLLREAGYSPEDQRPLRLRLMVPEEAPWYRQIGELAADAARAAGIDFELQSLAFKVLLDRHRGDDWDAAMLQVNMPAFGDPYELFHSAGGRNGMHWSNAEADDLLAQQRTELDVVRRGGLLQQFHRIVAAEQPCALLLHPMAEVLLNAHLQGVDLGACGLWPERFWVPKEFQRGGP